VQGVYRAERRVGGLVFAVHLRRGGAAPGARAKVSRLKRPMKRCSACPLPSVLMSPRHQEIPKDAPLRPSGPRLAC
jgi:hypothetical protein